MINNTKESYIEFCNYIQPIVNGSAGFIKTSGYMSHIPGVILMMSEDETVFSMIRIPIVHNVYMASTINSFLALKEDNDKANVLNNTYSVGINIKHDHLISYYQNYSITDSNLKCIYFEPDCYNIPGFREASEGTIIDKVNISDGKNNYRIPASKSITQLTKADSANLKLYEIPNSNIKLVKYTVFKKKFGVYVEIFFNILPLS